MTRAIDLHSHSSASDGALAPAAVVERAVARGVAVLGLSDHDTLAGLPEAIAAGEAVGIRVVPAIELSARGDGLSVHMLGYLPGPVPQPLAETLERVVRARRNRNHDILENLARLGMPLAWDDVAGRAKGTVGRPHIAAAMVDAGYVSDMTEAFDRFLADDAPAFVPVGALTPTQAVELIAASGGAAVLAHPAQLKLPPAALAGVIDTLAEAGMRGIEAYRPEHDEATRTQLAGLAETRGLVATAGSDFHRPPVDGGPELGGVGPLPGDFDPLPALGL